MSEVSEMHNQGEEQLELPPGFRFHPTDEEVVSHYLIPKALSCLFTCLVIADVDLNKCEPWELPGKAKMGEKEWYFFCHKDRKYPTGTRTNRATASGYWKATGKDKEIFRGRGVLVGMKKTLVFYLGRAPHGKKTPWVMHEYRIAGGLPPNLPRAAKDEWAVCRVFNKEYLAAKPGLQQTASRSSPAAAGTMQRSDSLAFLDDLLDPADLPPLTDSPFADDFKGAAVPGSMSNMISGCQQVKTEQPAPAQNPPPPALTQDTAYSYFSLPATNNNSGGYSHHPQAAGAGHLSAIRRHCTATATAPAPASPDIARTPLYPELESLDDLGGFMDYSNMWKC